jgi:hypothetical protein
MSFHTFLSSEPKLDEKMKNELIKETFVWMRRLLLQKDYLLSSKRFHQFTEKFFKQLGYLFDQEKYDAMPENVFQAPYVVGGRNKKKINSQKYSTELSWEVFKGISEYYNTKWKRINKRLYRNRNSQTGRQEILADAFLNYSNGMDFNKIYTQIITNNEFEDEEENDEEEKCSFSDTVWRMFCEPAGAHDNPPPLQLYNNLYDANKF